MCFKSAEFVNDSYSRWSNGSPSLKPFHYKIVKSINGVSNHTNILFIIESDIKCKKFVRFCKLYKNINRGMRKYFKTCIYMHFNYFDINNIPILFSEIKQHRS